MIRCKMEGIALVNLIESLQKQTDEEFFEKSNDDCNIVHNEKKN